MIEPVVVTALILSILALIAYYPQPQQPHHQRHYYHQVRRSRVMADPQRRSRGGDVDRGREGWGRGGEGEVYERDTEEEGREADEWAIGVQELGLEGGVDVGDEEMVGAKTMRECCGIGEDGVDAALCYASSDALGQKRDIHTNTASQHPSPPIIRLTIPDSDITSSTVLPSQDAENGLPREDCCSNTLNQQRRQRVRFDEALRMHSYGGSQYVGRVVDKDIERRAVLRKEREEAGEEPCRGSDERYE